MEKVKIEKKDLMYLFGICRAISLIEHFTEDSKKDVEQHIEKLENKYL